MIGFEYDPNYQVAPILYVGAATALPYDDAAAVRTDISVYSTTEVDNLIDAASQPLFAGEPDLPYADAEEVISALGLDLIYQPLDPALDELSALADAAGVLTNDGAGNFSWSSTSALVELFTGGGTLPYADSAAALSAIGAAASAHTHPQSDITDLVTDLASKQDQHALLDDISGLTLTKGDILVHDGTNLSKLDAGTDGYVISYDSGEASGLKAIPVATTDAAFAAISVSGSIDGSNLVYTLGEAVGDRALVIVNGSVQQEIADYTISGTTLTFVSAPLSGSEIEVKAIAGSSGGSITDLTPVWARAIGRVDAMQMRPQPGTVNFTATGMAAFTGQGGGYTARTPAYGTGKTAMNRVSFNLSTTTVAGWYASTATTVWTGGRFTFIINFAITESSFVTGARGFIGLTNATGAASNVNPATLTQCIGIGQIDGDATQFHAVWGAGSANNEGLGIAFDVDSAYQLEISSADTDGAFSLTLRNLSTGEVATINKTNGPASATSLIPRLWRCANGTGTLCGWDSGNLLIVREFV